MGEVGSTVRLVEARRRRKDSRTRPEPADEPVSVDRPETVLLSEEDCEEEELGRSVRSSIAVVWDEEGWIGRAY